jgi:hypothetical protein
MWFGVNIFLKGECATRATDETLWEERVVLIQALSKHEARARAEQIGRESECQYVSGTGELIEWKFVTVERVHQIEGEDLDPGTEVFSRFLRATEAESLLKPFEEGEGTTGTTA